ncbi:UNVERIFIED_CONTAM: hypothetical protein FKN15_008357 [Acipenser sinensis]
MVASQRGCVEAVRALLAFGADVRRVDSLGEDAVHYATQSGNEEVVTMLKNAQKNTGSEMLHSDGNESGQPFESVELDALRRLEGALEAKGSAERRVSEIEGHLDNMRAVLSQYETRKRVQSCVIEDLETQARLETHFVPMEDHRRCKASWEGSVKELEKMVLKLRSENQELRREDNLREEGGRRECVGLQRHPGNPGTLKSRPVSCRESDEPKTVGTTRAWQSEGLLLSEKQNGTHSSLTKSEDHLQQLCKVDKATCTNTQYSPLNIKEKDFLQGVSVFPRPSGYFKGDDFLNKDELEEAVTRKRMGKVFLQLCPGGLDFPGDGKKADWRTWNCGEAAVEKFGRQEFLTQEVFGKTNLERDEEKGMPDSSGLLKDRSEREADISKIQGLMVDITHLEEDLALEQQVS